MKTTERGVIWSIQVGRSLSGPRGGGKGPRRGEERYVCVGGEGGNVGLKIVSLEESVKVGEVFNKVRLKNRTREKSVSLIPCGKDRSQWGQ